MATHSFRHFVISFWDQHRSPILRLAVILGTLGMAALFGKLVTSQRFEPTIVAGAAVASLGLLLTYRYGRMEYGILLIVVTAGLVNFITLPTGTDSRIVMSLVVAAGLMAFWLLKPVLTRRRTQLLKPSPLNKPVLAFVIVNCLAYVWSNVFRDSVLYIWRSFPIVQVAALVVNILLPGLTLLISNKITDLKWLKGLGWLMLGMGAFWATGVLFGLPLDMFYTRGSSGLFAMWVTALAYSLALFDNKLPGWLRGALLGLAAAIVYRNFILARLWLSGWVPMFAALAVITLLRSRWLFLLAVLVGVVHIATDFDYYYQEVYVANAEEGGLQRLDLWRINLAHVANHPLLGMGPAGYAVYNMTYNPQDARSTHNNYFDILAQTGLIGFGMFLWLILTIAWFGFRTWRLLSGKRNFEEGFAAAVLGGWAAALAAMMLGDWVIPFAYNGTIAAFDHALYTWVFAGGMVSLYHLLSASNPRR